MTTTEKRTFSLPAEQAAFIDAQVNSGSFASASEVVRAGLRALQERDAAVERWLREDVVTTYDRWKADPSGGLSPQEMAERMRQRHADHPKTTREAAARHLFWRGRRRSRLDL